MAARLGSVPCKLSSEIVTTFRYGDDGGHAAAQLLEVDPADQKRFCREVAPEIRETWFALQPRPPPARTGSPRWPSPSRAGPITATRSAPARSPRIALRLRSGLGQDRQDHPLGMDGQRDHGSTPSKSAEPTRTRVAPSSTAASKSLDIPIDSSASGNPV